MREDEPTAGYDGVRCIRATEKALLCEINGKQEWVPRSQIAHDSEVNDVDDEGTLRVSQWLAEQKGWD